MEETAAPHASAYGVARGDGQALLQHLLSQTQEKDPASARRHRLQRKIEKLDTAQLDELEQFLDEAFCG